MFLLEQLRVSYLPVPDFLTPEDSTCSIHVGIPTIHLVFTKCSKTSMTSVRTRNLSGGSLISPQLLSLVPPKYKYCRSPEIPLPSPPSKRDKVQRDINLHSICVFFILNVFSLMITLQSVFCGSFQKIPLLLISVIHRLCYKKPRLMAQLHRKDRTQESGHGYRKEGAL